MKKLLLTLICLIKLCISAAAEEACITILPGDFGEEKAYFKEDKSAEIGGVKFTACYMNPSTGQINNGGFYLYNTTQMPGDITKVVITEKSGTFKPTTTYLNLDTKTISTKPASGMVTGVESGETPKIVTLTVPSNDHYSYFILGGNIVSGTSCITDIKIYYKFDSSITFPTTCTAPTFSVENGANVYPGDKITFSSSTSDSSISSFKVNDVETAYESAGGGIFIHYS